MSMKTLRNIMHIGNLFGVEQVSAIAQIDNREQPVILNKSEYDLWLLLRSYQEKYHISEVDIDSLHISFSDDIMRKYNIEDNDIETLVNTYQMSLLEIEEEF